MIRFALLAALPVVAALAQGPKPIFDGRLTLRPGKLSSAEEKLFQEKVALVARREWKSRDKDSVCEPGFKPEAIDLASGPFTSPGAAQKAILYKYCTFGHGMALDGIAVIENDRVIAHILFEGGENNAIGALPDINTNGLAEIVIAAGSTNQGITSSWITLIELANGSITRLGHIETLSDDGNVEKATRISVIAGQTPAFFQETFVDRKKSGGPKPVALENDEVHYELVQ